MQKIFDEVASLDKRCYEEFGLSEDILMEHAASSMQSFIEDNFDQNSKVLIVCGVGNNGADGIALARLLHKKYNLSLVTPFGIKSAMAQLQLKRTNLVGIKETNTIKNDQYDVVLDCLFGSGLNKPLDAKSIEIINQMNSLRGYKIACDIPSGIDKDGKITTVAFQAHTTITMGALKKSLFLDGAKDFVGCIIVANLGVQRELYETKTNCYLLDQSDLKLPFRTAQNTHKGTFGHLSVISGCRSGAAVLTALAGFNMGSGLVSVVGHENLSLPYHIMQSHKIPQNTTALALGMGLGNFDKSEIEDILSLDIPKLIDADLFYSELLVKNLNQTNLILTPHPKEFCSLLKLCGIDNIDITTLQNNRFEYFSKFCAKYPNVVLLLKGSNVIIGQGKQLFINPYGSSKLSFGGSGDVLAGIIASLLAQGYSCMDATLNGSLIHAKVASDYDKNDYSMTPQDLIDGLKTI